MNKKVILVVLAVLAFFIGQIWLESVLGTTKTFAAFLLPVFELIAGGFIGFFWCKNRDESLIDFYETQYTDTKAEMIHLENEIINLKKPKTAKPSSKKATKVS